MPSRAPVSTTHHPQHGHGRPARVEVHTAGGALVRPGQGRATLTPPHHHHHRCLLPPPPPLVGLCLYQTVWQRPREPGDIISEKKTAETQTGGRRRTRSASLPSPRRSRSLSASPGRWRGYLRCCSRCAGGEGGGSDPACGSAAPPRRRDIRLVVIASNGSSWGGKEGWSSPGWEVEGEKARERQRGREGATLWTERCLGVLRAAPDRLVGREGGSSSEAVTADSLIDDPAEDRISFIQRFIRITS